MCTDCNELTIPIGPTGPTGATGATGPAGSNGSNGTNGTNGTDGTSILYSDLTEVQNGGASNTELLYNYTVPANTLLNIGDEIEVELFFATNLNGTGSLIFQIGGAVSITFPLTNLYVYSTKFKICKTSSTTVTVFGISLRNTAFTNNTTFEVPSTTGTLNGAIPNILNILCYNSSGGAGQISSSKFTVYKYKI